MNTSSLFTDHDYMQPPPSGVYTYKELSLSYRRNWIDIHNQLVYKIPSFLFKKLRYYIGPIVGVTAELHSRIHENIVDYRATPNQNGGQTITEISNRSQEQKARSAVSPYMGFTGGSEFNTNGPISVLLECNVQGYFNPNSQKKVLYKDGQGYLSLIMRYNF
jgi:hypothetical protein